MGVAELVEGVARAVKALGSLVEGLRAEAQGGHARGEKWARRGRETGAKEWTRAEEGVLGTMHEAMNRTRKDRGCDCGGCCCSGG